jgi:hypothetical protein
MIPAHLFSNEAVTFFLEVLSCIASTKLSEKSKGAFFRIYNAPPKTASLWSKIIVIDHYKSASPRRTAVQYAKIIVADKKKKS